MQIDVVSPRCFGAAVMWAFGNPRGGVVLKVLSRRMRTRDVTTAGPAAPACGAVVVRRRSWICLGLCLGLAVSTALSIVAAAPALADSPLTWSAPMTIDEESIPAPISDVSCPSTALCVAGDVDGHLVTSIDPTSPSAVWTAADADSDNWIRAVSCPSVSLCVAVDQSAGSAPAFADSQVVTSTDPTGGTPAWAPGTLGDVSGDGVTEMQDVSCVVGLCVAVGSGGGFVGEIATSTDPAGGSGTWTLSALTGVGILQAVSCVSTTLCVAVNGAGQLLTSTDPAGGPSTWALTQLPGGGPSFLSCPSAKLCMAAENGGVWTSTNPAGGASTWTFSPGADANPAGFDGVSCASASLCVAVDNAGNVVTSTNPTGGAAAWSTTNLDRAASFLGVSCVPNSAACVVVGNGDLASSTNPTAGVGSWTVQYNPDGFTAPFGVRNTMEDVSCLAGPLCVAVDNNGNVVTSTNPAGGPSAWTSTEIDGSNVINAVSCIAGPLCVAVDADGNILTSADPTGGVSAWTVTDVDGATAIGGISCVAGPLCVAGDADANALTSFEPAGGALAWSSVALGAASFDPVSCASVSLCVGLDRGYGTFVSSSDPAGGSGAWTDEGNLLYTPAAVSCVSTSLCVLVSGGEVLTTTDPFTTPTEDPGAWTATRVEPLSGYPTDAQAALIAVDCPSASLCVAITIDSTVVTSTDPTGPASAWSLTNPEDNGPQAVSCASISLCVAVGADGQAVVGTGQPATLAVAVGGSGAGTVSTTGISCPGACAQSYAAGTTLTLTATPALGSTFVGWSGGGCSGTATCTVTMAADLNVTATFNTSTTLGLPPLANGVLNVAIIGAGAGKVTAAPDIACPTACSAAYPSGSIVTLTASPAAGSTFAGWTGVCTGTGPCSVTIDGGATENVSAMFAQVAKASTVSKACTKAEAAVTKQAAKVRKAKGARKTAAKKKLKKLKAAAAKTCSNKG
jgi:hypothetical protein